jgi:hypothetical protein
MATTANATSDRGKRQRVQWVDLESIDRIRRVAPIAEASNDDSGHRERRALSHNEEEDIPRHRADGDRAVPNPFAPVASAITGRGMVG